MRAMIHLKNRTEKMTHETQAAKTTNSPETTSVANEPKSSAQPVAQAQGTQAVPGVVNAPKGGQQAMPGQNVGGVNSVLGEAVRLSPAQSPSGSESTNISERINQIQQLLSKTSGSVLKLANGGGGKMTLRLDPPAMGRLQVQVEIMRGVCQARILADDPTVKAALMQSLPQLREALETQGLKLEGFTVEDHSNQSFSGNSAAQQQKDGSRTWHESQYPADPIEIENKSDTKGVKHRPGLGVIDLHV